MELALEVAASLGLLGLVVGWRTMVDRWRRRRAVTWAQGRRLVLHRADVDWRSTMLDWRSGSPTLLRIEWTDPGGERWSGRLVVPRRGYEPYVDDGPGGAVRERLMHPPR